MVRIAAWPVAEAVGRVFVVHSCRFLFSDSYVGYIGYEFVDSVDSLKVMSLLVRRSLAQSGPLDMVDELTFTSSYA